MIDFLVQKLVQARKKNILNYKSHTHKNIFQLGFSLKIEMLQLGSAQLGKFQLELITNT